MKQSLLCASACNKLLRGEISAVESYTQAIEKCDEVTAVQTLDKIRSDHQKNADTLRSHILSMKAVPDSGSGMWGTFAKTVEGAAALLSDSAAISALVTGEKLGITDYEEALQNPDVMEEIKSTIRTEMLPGLREHLVTLEQVSHK